MYLLNSKGTLYLLPAWLGENSSNSIFSEELKSLVPKLTHYIVENEKSARRFLRFIYPEINQQELTLFKFNKKSELTEIQEILNVLKKGEDCGLLSEAGLPCIADPGNKVVEYCHENDIKVTPITGPSSIILALISSGLNGQNFSFNGYLPIDKTLLKKKLIELENLSLKNNSAQIFMETPFRNNAFLENLLQFLNPNTKLCVACNITLDSEFIKTKTIAEWKKSKIDLHKQPTIFIIQSN
ncbi:MAG: SAM-dependent methyltransferase [Flavobacteriales bacterium]|nr:SAM-dependent methyltransferase [Flavobacteriales bacterium]